MSEASDGPPAWLLEFEFGSWVRGASPDSPNVEMARPRSARDMVEWCAAQRRWKAARREWLKANGRIMRDVWPEKYEDFQRQADQSPSRVVERDWRAESALFREDVKYRLAWGRTFDQGEDLTADEADFPVYRTPDLEEGS